MARRSTSGLTRSEKRKVTKMRYIPLFAGVEVICSIGLEFDVGKHS